MSLRHPVVDHQQAWRTAAEIVLALLISSVLLVLACTAVVGLVFTHG